MKFSICNLGCKVNAYEAESVASLLEKKGWQRVDFEEEADYFIEEIEKILTALEAAIQFTNEWKASKINPRIDNTKY